jgi:hypothetical protein
LPANGLVQAETGPDPEGVNRSVVGPEDLGGGGPRPAVVEGDTEHVALVGRQAPGGLMEGGPPVEARGRPLSQGQVTQVPADLVGGQGVIVTGRRRGDVLEPATNPGDRVVEEFIRQLAGLLRRKGGQHLAGVVFEPVADRVDQAGERLSVPGQVAGDEVRRVVGPEIFHGGHRRKEAVEWE